MSILWNGEWASYVVLLSNLRSDVAHNGLQLLCELAYAVSICVKLVVSSTDACQHSLWAISGASDKAVFLRVCSTPGVVSNVMMQNGCCTPSRACLQPLCWPDSVCQLPTHHFNDTILQSNTQIHQLTFKLRNGARVVIQLLAPALVLGHCVDACWCCVYSFGSLPTCIRFIRFFVTSFIRFSFILQKVPQRELEKERVWETFQDSSQHVHLYTSYTSNLVLICHF